MFIELLNSIQFDWPGLDWIELTVIGGGGGGGEGEGVADIDSVIGDLIHRIQLNVNNFHSHYSILQVNERKKEKTINCGRVELKLTLKLICN